MSHLFRFTAPGALCLGLAAFAKPAAAGDPARVRVNNVELTPPEVAALVVLNCHAGIPGGDYWIDFQTGAWGYAGGVREGTLACYDAPIADPVLAAERSARVRARAAYAALVHAPAAP